MKVRAIDRDEEGKEGNLVVVCDNWVTVVCEEIEGRWISDEGENSRENKRSNLSKRGLWWPKTNLCQRPQ
ncbi:hypothetical protein VNO77_27870 [Canavalia gladiata]|uniref:Uncharacterized protein n=1 Tax=Canavalia gladiata TaxID=3824 RepID=A0AAN9KXP1_CANGL